MNIITDSLRIVKKSIFMRPRGIEPRSQPSEGYVLSVEPRARKKFSSIKAIYSSVFFAKVAKRLYEMEELKAEITGRQNKRP